MDIKYIDGKHYSKGRNWLWIESDKKDWTSGFNGDRLALSFEPKAAEELAEFFRNEAQKVGG